MKTKITTFLMLISFFFISIAFADEVPGSKTDDLKQGYFGTPIEIPKPLELRLDVQITVFLAELFDIQWRPMIAEKEYSATLHDRN